MRPCGTKQLNNGVSSSFPWVNYNGDALDVCALHIWCVIRVEEECIILAVNRLWMSLYDPPLPNKS